MPECNLKIPGYKKKRLKHLVVPETLKIRGKDWQIYYAKNMPKWAVTDGLKEEL